MLSQRFSHQPYYPLQMLHLAPQILSNREWCQLLSIWEDRLFDFLHEEKCNDDCRWDVELDLAGRPVFRFSVPNRSSNCAYFTPEDLQVPETYESSNVIEKLENFRNKIRSVVSRQLV